MAGAYGFPTGLRFTGTQTLSGIGEIVFAGTDSGNSVYASGGSDTSPAILTIGPGITIHGSQGGYIRGSYSNDSIINQGTITADTFGRTIEVSGANWINTGLLKAQNGGTLSLKGTFTHSGTLDATGSTIAVAGTLDNTGKTLALTDSTGPLTLALGGTIKGGTITAINGAMLLVLGGTLDGVILDAPTTVESSKSLTVKNGLTLNRTLTLNSATSSYTNLSLIGTQTLSGTGEIIFAGTISANRISVQESGANSPAILTIGPGITIHGSQGGYIHGLYSNDSIINQGTIIAETSGKTIELRGANWTNAGLLKAQNGGTLNLGGTISRIGAFDATGGTVSITGTLDNQGSTLTLPDGVGPLTLAQYGTIKGGTITATGSGTLIGAGGTLDGVILNAPTTIEPSKSLIVKNGLNLNSTLTLSSVSSSLRASLYFDGTQTLSGIGEVVFRGLSYPGFVHSRGDGFDNPATLTIGHGITIHGDWGLVSGYYSYDSNDSIINQGTIIAETSGKSIEVRGANWTNAGLLKAQNGGTLNLGGTISRVGAFDATGGTVSITGTLDNQGSTLTLPDASGFLTLGSTGTIKGGTIAATGSGALLASDGTLEGVTLNAPTTVRRLTVKDGLTLNSIMTLSGQASSYTYLVFEGTQTLSGTGEVVFWGTGLGNYLMAQGDDPGNPATLTIGSDVTIRGSGQGSISTGYTGDRIIDLGSVQIDAGYSILLNGHLTLDHLNRISTQPTAELRISGNLLGTTRNVDLYSPLGTTHFDGSGTSASPQTLEVMSRDAGIDPSSFAENFSYGTIRLSNNTYVRLVDLSDNATGTDPEALYVNSLIVPSGTTLNLNGLHLYARAAQISGTITGGTVTQLPDSGPLIFGTPTSGTISVSGEIDEWTFFGRGGRGITVNVNPGGSSSPAPLSPYLNYAQIQLLDENNNVLAAATNSFSGAMVSLTGVLLPADGTYRIRINAPSGQPSATGNYVVTGWDGSVDTSSLVIDKEVTGLIETPYSTDKWIFSASQNTQVRFDLINASSQYIAFDLTGPSGTVFTNITADSDFITLPSSGTYTLTAQGTGGQYGGAYAFNMRSNNPINIVEGIPYFGSLAGSSQAQLFRLTLNDSTSIEVVLDDFAAADRNELYIKFGAPPTRADYDYCSSSASADQKIVIPMAAPGTWYILAYGDYVPSPTNYTITAAASGIILGSATPDRSGTGVPTILTIKGAGFDATTSVALVASNGTRFDASSVSFDSFRQLTSTFDANTVPAGTYSLEVKQSDGDSAQLSNFFTMTTGSLPNLVANLVVPSALGRHAGATLYIEYANTGDVAMPAPLLILDGTQDKALLTLYQAKTISGFWTSAIPEGFSSTIQILASGQTSGVLQPGESFRIPVYYVGLQTPWDFTDNQVNLNLGVLTADNTALMDWSPLKEDMRPDSISIEAWEQIWANFITEAGTTWGDYVSMLDNNASYLSRLEERVVDVGQLLGFEFQQADNLSAVKTLAGATDASIGAPGMAVTFSRAFPEVISLRYEQGRFGYGWLDGWDYSLLTRTDGTVEISEPGGSTRIFQPDSRRPGSYFSESGDYGILSASGSNTFVLTEKDGTISAFRSDGKLNYIQDTNGNRITCAYTGNLLTGLTHSSGQAILIAYNAAGHVQSITDSLGRQSKFTYDIANKHLMSVEDFRGEVTRYTYGEGASAHALTSIEYPGATHRFFSYDSEGRLSGTWKDGGAEAVSYTYDSAGKVSATDALGNTSALYFDHRGLLVKSVDALGNPVTMTFDKNNNLMSLTDPGGHANYYSYDGKGNILRSADALGNLTHFSYEGTYNRLISLIDANGNQTSYTYDAHGNLTAMTYAGGSTDRWNYNSFGEIAESINGRGHAITYAYDASGRITSKAYVDGSQVSYTYDAHGNLVTQTDATGITTYTYDADDRLTRIDYPGAHFLTFTYDLAGRRASSTDELGHRLDYHYDPVGRLSSLTDETRSEIVRYTYDGAGRITRQDLGNGVYTTYAYDAAGQLLHLVNYQSNSSVLSRFDYTYDSLGNRTSMATLDGKWTYTYDDIGQLIHAVFASTNPAIPNQDLAYVYDSVGNRIRTIENGISVNYTTNNMNHYTQVGGTTYRYDADGNLIQEISPAGTTTYTYNDENKLIAVTSPSGTWAYTYDGQGNRAVVTENGVTKRYVIDPVGLGNVVGEYTNAGLLSRYTHGLGLVSMTTGINTAYYTYDALGSTSELTDAAQVISNSYVYAPFGKILEQTSLQLNPFQFVGQWGVMEQENGLSFMRARYYDASVGKFTSSDPLGIAAGDLNLYRYVGNDAIAEIDASGLYEVKNEKQFITGLIQMSSGLVGALGSAAVMVETAGLGTPLAWGVFVTGFYSMGAGFQNLCDSQFDQYSNVPEGPMEGFGASLDMLFNQYGQFQNAGKLLDLLFMWRTERSIFKTTEMWEQVLTALSLSWEYFGDINWVDGPTPIAQTVDPNEKLGRSGYGPEGYVSSDGNFPYRIDFENESSATAPVQRVTITDQLDNDLDWSTFELAEFAFGDTIISVPENLSHYETTVSTIYNNETFDVQIEAGINLSTGTVYAIFQAIDPDTSLPPDVLTGFLPPEDGTGRGMGHVSYLIDPKNGLVTGTEIRNIALISFDGQPQIATNQVDPHDPSKGTDPSKEALNTIDAGTPTSSVLALPPTTTSPGFLVSWTGLDDASGIATYDIYASVDGGAFALWKGDTADTSAMYSGLTGHTYSFYSVAMDHVGHLEAPPSSPDASITVMASNTAPIANGDTYSVNEDTNLSLAAPGILANDTDADGNALSAVLVAGPSHGALTLNGDGSFTYTPTANYNGSDSFTYKAYDGKVDSNVATVSITVNSINDAPVAVNDTYTTNEDTQLEIVGLGVLGNDTDVEGNPLTSVLVTGPSHGTLTLNSNGSFTYTPTANYNGSDSFSYKANDGTADSNVATVTINITPVNDAPVAVNDAFTTDEDTPLVVYASGLLGNDTDIDENPLMSLLVTGPSHGALTLNGDGSFTYTPAANYYGADSFTYRANDGKADSGIASVNLTITPVNDAPVAQNDSYNAVENVPLTVSATQGVLVNDSDVDGGALAAAIVDGPTHGTLNLNADGSFSYTPNANYFGLDSFTYKVNDGQVDSQAATVSLTVTPVNDAPVAVDDAYTTGEDTPLTVAAAQGVLTNDADIENDNLTSVLVSGPTHGTLTLNTNGSFTYAPNQNFNGSDTFTYKAYDGKTDSNVATVSINVTAVNDAPVAVNDAFTTDEDTPLVVYASGLLGNDTDIDGNPLTSLLVTGPSHGALTLNGDGSFTYTPTANYNESDSFSYKANDGTADSNVATVSITVNPENTAPVARDDSYTIYEDGILTVGPGEGLLPNDTDADGNTLASMLVSGPMSGTLSLSPDGSFTYTPATNYNGSDSFSYKANDGTADSNVATVTINITPVNDAPVADIAGDPRTVDEGSTLNLVATASDPDGDTLTYAWNFGDGSPAVVGTLTPSHTYADNGIYTVTFTAIDSKGATGTDTLAVTALNVAPAVTSSLSTQSIQYSDPIKTVTFTATDQSSVDTMNAAFSYSFNSGAFTAGLPDALSIAGGLSLAGSAGQTSAATWTLSGIADLNPGTYTIRATITDDDNGVGQKDATLVVGKEDAQAGYVGPVFVSTPSIKDTKATVELRAVIQDINALTSSADSNAGNISTATVTFVNRDANNAVIATVPVSLLNAGDIKTGVAVFNWQVDLGSKNSEAYTIGVIVNGNYSRNASADNTVVTVSKPLSDFITGGGYIVNQNSGGTYAGDTGLKTNFGFNLKFNKQLTNLQGKFTAIVRDGDHVYQIKTNAMDSLVVNPTTKTSTFTSKANLIDITNPSVPVSIAGNLSLVVTLTDKGEPGSSDSIGFTLWKGSELLFSSNWNGAKTVEQVLTGGNLVVRAGTALQAAGEVAGEQADAKALTPEQLQPITTEAISRWAASGVGVDSIKALNDVQIQIADLNGSNLGLAFDNTIWIDSDAAGYGWFIDLTPFDNQEFRPTRITGELTAMPSGPTSGGMDLLTVVMHELGHVLGHQDLDPQTHSLMSATLTVGERNLVEDATSQHQGGPTKLVVMEPRGKDASALIAMEEIKNQWLTNFLVNPRQNDYTNPNDGITIKIFEDGNEDTNSNPGRRYGKRARA